ncbi:MAG: hypothetical protein Altm1KO_30790 [Alteromonas macleodii]
MDTVEFIQIRRFIVKLGKMLHKYGTPAFRLEAYLGEVAKYLGVHASFISTPTSLTFVIWSDRHEDEYNHAARLLPGELDMNALSLTDELASELLSGKLTLSEADKRLNEIDAMGSPYGKWVTGVAFAMATGAFAMLMGASWSEIGWSGALVFCGLSLDLWDTAVETRKLDARACHAVRCRILACAIESYVDPGITFRWLCFHR